MLTLNVQLEIDQNYSGYRYYIHFVTRSGQKVHRTRHLGNTHLNKMQQTSMQTNIQDEHI